MTKIELTLTPDYIPNWTLVDAVRELFQNALDQQTQSPGNTASWTYKPETKTLQIRNKQSVLPLKSLLLGASTKAGDTTTVGQFGEGYKLAALVLLRLGKTLTIYNYSAREVWQPKFVNSRRFGTEILTFFIEKSVWRTPPHDDLIFEVGNLDVDEYYAQIVPSNLWLQEYLPMHKTEYGEILHETYKGKVFVNGLFVCMYPSYKYGYNFNAGQLKLDRDRKLASDFDLKWLASRMWAGQPDALDMIVDGVADVAYLAEYNNYFCASYLRDDAYERFAQVCGPHAVPVSTQAEADAVPAGYSAIFVNSAYQKLIVTSRLYTAPPVDSGPTLVERLAEWLEVYRDMLPERGIHSLELIIKEMGTAN